MGSVVDLSEAVVIVTGASCGIGAATAEALARRGTHVVAVARRTELLGATVARCGRLGTDAFAVTADICAPEAPAAIVAAAIDRYGRIDALVNNAGIHAFGPAVDVTPDLAEQVFGTNFLAAVALTKASLRHLLARGRGAIVNVTSVTAYVPDPGEAIYGASKAALSLWSHVLALELADTGVSVTVVSPGPIDTETMAGTEAYYAGHRFPAKVVANTILAAIQQGFIHRTVPRRFGIPAALYPSLGPPMRAGLRHARRRVLLSGADGRTPPC